MLMKKRTMQEIKRKIILKGKVAGVRLTHEK
jgi:hypothetical protein